MIDQTADIKFIKVTPEILEHFFDTASSRIVIAKAGYSINEVEQLIRLVSEKKINCSVYVETGENAIRYGFGDQKALQLLEQNTEILKVQIVNQIRMSIVIIDETILAYAPVALSWEKVPDNLEFPNGLLGGKFLAETLLKQIGGTTITLPVEEETQFTISIPRIPQREPNEVKQEIEKINKSLNKNPPVDPAKLRNTVFYRNRFKLLKMTIHGAKIKNKRIDLRPFNSMFPETDNRLKASWNVFSRTDEQKLTPFKEFNNQLKTVKSKNTIDVNRHGDLIKTTDIQSFEKEICQLVEKLTKNLLDIETKQQESTESDFVSLNNLLSNSKQALTDYLYTLAIKEEKCWEELFANERSLYRKLKDNNTKEKEGSVKEAINTFIDIKLKFPINEELIEQISVEYDYYDVSNELLEDEQFIKTLEKFDVGVREYNQGFEEIKKIELHHEFD